MQPQNLRTHYIPGHAFTITLQTTDEETYWVCEDADELVHLMGEYIADPTNLRLSVTNSQGEVVAYWSRIALGDGIAVCNDEP